MRATFTRPDAFRLLLFGGLILHKLVWEMLQTSAKVVSPKPGRAPSDVKRPAKKGVVKRAKAVFLVGLLAQTLFTTVFPITARPKRLQTAGLILFLAGLGTAIAGRVALGKSWSNIEDGTVGEGHALISGGVYRFIRHPIYAGDSLLLIGLQLALNSWLVGAMLFPVVIFARQAMAEEERLAQVIPGYDEYRRRTKGFIPFII